MKRPNQHIIETKSQKIFLSLIPDEWVTREMKPDYGVDYLVEIFSDNKSTGKTFFVQLKGSDQIIQNETIKIRFTIENLQYFNSSLLPVLIICISTTNKSCWAIWSNKLIDTIKKRENQKEFVLSLDKDYMIDSNFFNDLNRDFIIYKKLGFSYKSDSQTGTLLNNKIIEWVKKYYENSISIESKNLPHHLKLTYKRQSNNRLKVTLDFPSSQESVLIENVSFETPYLHKPVFNENDINELNSKLLFKLSLKLMSIDTNASLALLKKLIPMIEPNFISFKQIDPVSIVKLSTQNNELEGLQSLIKEIIKSERFDLFPLFDMAYFIIGNDKNDLREKRIENLNFIIDNISYDEILGSTHYNLANIYRQNDVNKAFYHYLKTRDFDKNYLNRSYYWYEIAGVLFLCGHYRCSEKSYRKSIEVECKKPKTSKYLRVQKNTESEIKNIEVLIADCLFFQGKFKEASEVFGKYINENEGVSEEWRLKCTLCDGFIINKLETNKFDRKGSYELCKLTIELKSKEEIIQNLTKAIELYPLNDLAWYNLGDTYKTQKNYSEAMFCYLSCGMINRKDKEALINALMMAYNEEDLKFFQSIFKYLFEAFDKTILNAVIDYIFNCDITKEMKIILSKNFKDMAEIIYPVLKVD